MTLKHVKINELHLKYSIHSHTFNIRDKSMILITFKEEENTSKTYFYNLL